MTSSLRNIFFLRRGDQSRSALAMLLVVAVVLGATLALHTFVGHERRATLGAPVSLGPLRVAAVTARGRSYERIALDASVGHVVALAGAVPRGCPPTGACALGSPATIFAVLDGVTGQPVATFSLAGPAASAASATILLADPTTHTAYAVAPNEVTRFSTADAHYEGGYALPAALGGALTGATLDAAHGSLVLAGITALAVVDADTGALRASVAIAALAAGPVLDPTTQRLFVLTRSQSSGSGMMLMAFDAASLAPLEECDVPAGALGPLDAADRALLLFGADGTTYRIALDGPLGATTSVTAASNLQGAFATGWNDTLGHTYRALANSLEALDTRTGAPLGTLPVTVLQPAGQPLAVDATRGLLYLPAAYGAVLIVRDTPAGAIDGATALLLARAALARFLPDTNQDPPFVSTETFPVAADPTAAGVARDYWIHFSDLGWQGPYPGSAGASVAPDPHHPGGSVVSFRIAWYQLFARSHTWVCAVAPDGTVSLQSDSGDAVP